MICNKPRKPVGSSGWMLVVFFLVIGSLWGRGGHCSHLPREEFSQFMGIPKSLQIRCSFSDPWGGSTGKSISHTRWATWVWSPELMGSSWMRWHAPVTPALLCWDGRQGQDLLWTAWASWSGVVWTRESLPQKQAGREVVSLAHVPWHPNPPSHIRYPHGDSNRNSTQGPMKRTYQSNPPLTLWAPPQFSPNISPLR